MTRWYTRQELVQMKTVSFNIGDYDQFACCNLKGYWWFTTESGLEKHNYFGPYRTRAQAGAAWDNVKDRTST